MRLFLLALVVTVPLLASSDRLERFPIVDFSEDAIARRLMEKARDFVSSSGPNVAAWDALPAELRGHIANAVQNHAAKLFAEYAVVGGDSVASAHAEGVRRAPFATAAERHQEIQRLLARADAERYGTVPRMADSASAYAGAAAAGGVFPGDAAAPAAAGAPAVTRAQPIPIPAELGANLPPSSRRRQLLSNLAAAPPRAPSGLSIAAAAASAAFEVPDVQPFHNPGAPAAADSRSDVVSHGGVSVRRIPPGTVKAFEVRTTSSVMATATDTTPAGGGAISPDHGDHGAAAAAPAGVPGAAGHAPAGVEVAADMELPPGRGHIVIHDALVQKPTDRSGRGLGPLAAGLADASERRLQAAAAAVRFPLSDPRHNIPPPPLHAPDEVPPAAAHAAADAGAASGFEASAHARRLGPLAAARRALPWSDTGVRMDAAELHARLLASAPAGPATAFGAAPAAPLVPDEHEAAGGAEADAARFLMLSDRGAGVAAGGAVLHAASGGSGPGPAAAFNGLYDASTGLSEPTKDCKKNVNTWLGKCVFTGSISGSAAASSGGAGQAMSKDCAKTLNTWLSSCVFKAK